MMRRPAQALLGLGLSVLCIALGLWIIDWGQVGRELRHVRVDWACMGVLALCISFACMAIRWRALLGDVPQFGFFQAFGHLMIGYMANAVLPLRPGDIVRAALVGNRTGATVAAVLSSIVLERVMDILTVVLIGCAVAFAVDLPPILSMALLVFGAAGMVLAGIICILSFRPELIGRIATPLHSASWAKNALGWLEPFLTGLATLRSPRRLARALCWDALAWGSYAIHMGAMLVAIQVPAPRIAAALLVMVAVSLSATIPSSPGAFGVYHAAALLCLAIWGVPTPSALAFALVTHAVAITLHIGLGAVSASAMGLHNVLRLARSGAP